VTGAHQVVRRPLDELAIRSPSAPPGLSPAIKRIALRLESNAKATCPTELRMTALSSGLRPSAFKGRLREGIGMEQTGWLSPNYRRSAGIVFIGLVVSWCGRAGSPAVSYIPANCNGAELTLFPGVGKALVVPLPPGLSCVGFGSDGKSVFARDVAKPKGDQRSLLRIELNPTRVSAADSEVSMQGIRSPDGKWVADLDHRRRKLALRDSKDPARTTALGRSGIMLPAWCPDSRYLVFEKWQWRCGLNFDVEMPETLEILDVTKHKRSTVQSSACKVQFGVNGFVSSDVVP
jgi:hypothetical protein